MDGTDVNAETDSMPEAGGTIHTPSVGDTVLVQSRTWSGMNKEGGTGRILAVDELARTCDVKYVLEARRDERNREPPSHDKWVVLYVSCETCDV